MAKASKVLVILLGIAIVALVIYYFILSRRVISSPTPSSTPSPTSSSPLTPSSPPSANPTVTITLNY
jgi:flagellar basal body-associated protein FliL